MSSAIKELKKISKKLPKFPDGRVNYRHSNIAVVIVVFVKYKNKILIVKRSKKVLTYKGLWNTIAGYYDEPKPLKKKALEELHEETGITKKYIKKIKIGKMFRVYDKKINKIWIVNTVLVELTKKPKIKLDFEATKSVWVYPKDVKKYKIVPSLMIGLRKVGV